MGKHKKHGYHHKSYSSSSSSSSSDDEYKHLPKEERKRMKKLRKQMKKGKIPPGSVPGMYPGAPHGMPHGAPYKAPHGAPHGPPHYPPGGSYPQPGGYPIGVAPPPAGYNMPRGQPGYPAPAPGYPAPAPGYPAPAPGYPGQPPAQGPGGFVAPGGAPPPAGYPGGPYPSGTQQQGYYGVPAQQPSYPSGAPSYPAGAPAQQPGYPAQQPGYPAQQPGYPAGAPPPQPGYPSQQPGYPSGAPPQQPGQPAGASPQQSGYGQPGAPQGQLGQGGPVDNTAAQFQKMGLQANVGLPRPTVRPAQNFSAERDAEIIRKAMKGMGTDEQAIIGVISQRSNQQRVQIMNMFKTMYGKDLIHDLESELSGDFRETIMALFKPTTYYDAWSLHQAISGLGTKEHVLIEILCTRTNTEIRQINQSYHEHYKRSLEKDIVSDTSGHFKRLLVSCCAANRNELTPDQWQKLQYQGMEAIVDRNLAREDAQKLFQAGEKKLGTDESMFLQVLAVRHEYQLRATFEEYVKISGRDILSSVDREMSGDLKEGFKAIILSAKNRPEYFADRLYSAMKGAGTQDSTLIRIIVSRSEIDLQDIKEMYLAKYRKTLATSVASDTSGDYKRLLLALIGQ